MKEELLRISCSINILIPDRLKREWRKEMSEPEQWKEKEKERQITSVESNLHCLIYQARDYNIDLKIHHHPKNRPRWSWTLQTFGQADLRNL